MHTPLLEVLQSTPDHTFLSVHLWHTSTGRILLTVSPRSTTRYGRPPSVNGYSQIILSSSFAVWYVIGEQQHRGWSVNHVQPSNKQRGSWLGWQVHLGRWSRREGTCTHVHVLVY